MLSLGEALHIEFQKVGVNVTVLAARKGGDT